MRKAVNKQLGELLLERKAVTPDQLNQALKLQQAKGGLLGQILVSLGYTTEEVIAQTLTAQYGFPYLPLKSYSIDEEYLKLVPQNVAKHYCLVPVDKVGDTLTVAMADPLNASAVEDIEMLSGCSVQVFVSTLSEVAEAIQRHYQQGEENHG